jgi:CRP-like cAMP-binding protein
MYGVSVSNRFIHKLASLVELARKDVTALEQATALGRRYPAGHDLIREGDEPGPVFVVLEGWVCRYKILPNGTRQIMAFLMPGDACDLNVSMLTEMDHSIQTLISAVVATISRSDMQAMMQAHPAIAQAMYTAQLVDEGILRSWIVSIGRRSSAERVAHLMCELYIRAFSIGMAAEGRCSLPMSQIVLADALGMTAVHANRVLKQLKDAGAMTLKRSELTIQDASILVQIAGFDENYLHRRLQRFAFLSKAERNQAAKAATAKQ